MRVELITDIVRLKAIESNWEALLSHTISNDFFLAPKWFFSWWDIFGKTEELYFVAIWAQDELLGLFPLKKKAGGVSMITFVGLPHSDRMDFLIKKGYEFSCLSEFKHWFIKRRDWDILFLRAFGPFSNFPQKLSNAFKDADMRLTLNEDSVYPYIVHSDFKNFDDYLNQTRKRSKRKEIRRLKKKLDEETSGSWRIVNQVDNTLLSEIREITDNKSIRGERGESFFLVQKNFQFLKKIIDDLQPIYAIRLFGYQIKGKYCSYLLCFDYDNKLYPYLTGFDQNYAKYSIGTLTILQAIQYGFDQTYKEFDFLEGAESYKFHWTKHMHQSMRFQLFNKGLKSLFLYFSFVKIKPVLKAINDRNGRGSTLLKGIRSLYQKFIH